MPSELLYDVLAITWLFGALAFWPIARVVDRRPAAYKVLYWLFVAHVSLFAAWAAWLFIFWMHGSHWGEGLLMFYLIGGGSLIVSLVAFVDWYVGHRRIRNTVPVEGGRVT